MLSPDWVVAFDSAVAGPLHAVRVPPLTAFFYVCTLMANTGTIVFLTTAAVLVLAFRRRWAEAVLVLVVVAGGQLLGTLAEGRSRPTAPAGRRGADRAAGLVLVPVRSLAGRDAALRRARVPARAGDVAPDEHASRWLRGRWC